MALVLSQISQIPGFALLLVFGAAAAYVASRACADSLLRGAPAPRPVLVALGHWPPIAATAWIAAAVGREEIALGVTLGVAVGCLSLTMGMVAYLVPPQSLPPSRRAWPFVMAAGLLIVVAGFRGSLGPMDALMLLALGACVAWVWHGAARDAGGADATLAEVLADAEEGGEGEWGMGNGGMGNGGMGNGGMGNDGMGSGAKTSGTDQSIPHSSIPHFRQDPTIHGREALIRAGQWIVAVGLAIAGARAIVLGTMEAAASTKLLPAGLLVSAGLSPLLVLPVLATATELAQRGRSAQACSGLVALALLNLCLLLPAIVLLWYFRSAIPAGEGLFAAIGRLREHGQPIPLPLPVWRIDAVVLTLLGLMLIPLALRRWSLTRLEAAAMVVVYAAYLAVTARLYVR